MYCRSCDIFQRNSKTMKKAKAPIMMPPITEQPFTRISLDVVGPLPETVKQNSFIVIKVCHSTK